MSSFESMSATLRPSEYGIQTSPFRERNYAAHSAIISYFGNRDLSEVGRVAFQSQLYFSMLAAALQRNANSESLTLT